MKKAAIADRFVIRSGFEPETHSLEGCCSIQLSYQTKYKIKNAISFYLNEYHRDFVTTTRRLGGV